MVLDHELITYDHMSNNNNDYALWFLLLNLNNDYEGRLPQLIIQTLSSHPEMMIVNNSKKEFAYDYIIKNQVSYNIYLDYHCYYSYNYNYILTVVYSHYLRWYWTVN